MLVTKKFSPRLLCLWTLLQGEGATPIKQDVKKGNLRFYHEVPCRCLPGVLQQGQRKASLHVTPQLSLAHRSISVSAVRLPELMNAGDSLELRHAATDLGGA